MPVACLAEMATCLCHMAKNWLKSCVPTNQIRSCRRSDLDGVPRTTVIFLCLARERVQNAAEQLLLEKVSVWEKSQRQKESRILCMHFTRMLTGWNKLPTI